MLFNHAHKAPTYATPSPVLLKHQLMQDIASNQLQRPMTYFRDYFAAQGSPEHAMLGNLSTFADAIDALVGVSPKAKYLSAYLRKQISMAPSADEPVWVSVTL